VERARVSALLCALWLLACDERASPGRDAGLAGLVLSAEPAPAEMPIRLGTEFDDRVELLGAKLTPAQGLRPGQPAELTLYWRKHAALDEGFRLFTHVLDEAGERVLTLDGVGPLRQAQANGLGPSSWSDGRIYVDKQSFTVPITLRTDSLTIVSGLYRGDQRLKVTRGPQRGDRGVVVKASVTRPLGQSLTLVPQLWLPRRQPSWPIVIDGKLDEPAWARAASTGQLVNVSTGEPTTGSDVTGSVKLLFDDESLYVGFEVFDDDLRGGFDPKQIDPQLWTRDTVEIIVDPDGDGDNLDYYEIQVNPQNLVFDSQFDAYNRPHQEPNGPFGHQEWSANLRSAVELHGTLDVQDEDDGYVVELAIPWKSFARAKRTPPRPEDVWRMNFYAMQNNGGAAWSPILGQGNFHKASRFGRVHFSK
jgi:hypothetical protein